MKELALVKFIKQNENWNELLSNPPYCLKIKQYDHFFLFYYNQLESDFSIDEVKEARGIILDSTDWSVVRFAFRKFFNFGEPNNDVKIDWDSAVVSEKIDGSLVSAWWDRYERKWQWSTSKTIRAFEAETPNSVNCPYQNYQELIDKALENCLFDEQSFCRSYTYNFELVSPYTQVVIPYEKPKLYFLCAVNNETLEEIPCWDYPSTWDKPCRFAFKGYRACKEMADQLPWDEEGYVVRDKFGHRVKIKSPEYVKAHYIRNNNVITKKKLIQVILDNEVDEFLTYCPDYLDTLGGVEAEMNNAIYRCEKGLSCMSVSSKGQWREWTGEQIRTLIDKIPFCNLSYVQNYIWMNWKNPNLLPNEYMKNFTAGQWEKILTK